MARSARNLTRIAFPAAYLNVVDILTSRPGDDGRRTALRRAVGGDRARTAATTAGGVRSRLRRCCWRNAGCREAAAHKSGQGQSGRRGSREDRGDRRGRSTATHEVVEAAASPGRIKGVAAPAAKAPRRLRARKPKIVEEPAGRKRWWKAIWDAEQESAGCPRHPSCVIRQPLVTEGHLSRLSTSTLS
jgi:hypothetical protein